jgi:hypothetical protein
MVIKKTDVSGLLLTLQEIFFFKTLYLAAAAAQSLHILNKQGSP